MLQWLDVAIVPILVAAITAGIPAMVSVRKFHKQNNEQHTETAHALSVLTDMLGNMDGKVSDVATKIDQHIGEHRAADDLSNRRRKAASRT